ETSDQRDRTVVLTVSDPAARRHQFLVSLERPHDGGSFALDTGFVTIPDVQRERGEIAVEGVGTLELAAAERDGMHRIDVRAQAFLKVTLPPGATIVSVEVAGEAAKPVLGLDGTRVPLLRPGFRPNGPYTVSFVYLHAGTPFARKGDMQMTLPKMDMPVGIVGWEVLVPDNYSMRAIGRYVIDQRTPIHERHSFSRSIGGVHSDGGEAV